MSGFLRRFSSAYRTAVAHEAAGEYIEAAKAYALCDERHKVAEMHILEAGRRAVPGSAAAELLVAVHLLIDDGDAPKLLLKRLGDALLRVVRSRDLVDSDRELLVYAARVLRQADEPSLAAEALERAGDIEQAVVLWQQAGEVERVEKLLLEQAQKRQQAQREHELFASYETALRLGQRDKAQQSLRALVEVARERREPQRLLDELSRRIPQTGAIELQLTSRMDEGSLVTERLLCAQVPLRIGRGEDCRLALLDPGVSRLHTQISHSAELGFVLADLGSKNGTFLDGIRVSEGATLPLRQQGDLGIGQHVQLQFTVIGGVLSLLVKSGLRRGLALRCAPDCLELAKGLQLQFVSGRPVLTAEEGDLRLSGQRVPSRVELIHGDVIERGPLRIEVL